MSAGLRIALRVEGDAWVAYIAQTGTMAGALRIASIRMNAITTEESRKAWVTAMTAIGQDFIATTTGLEVLEMDVSPAPESERAGRA